MIKIKSVIAFNVIRVKKKRSRNQVTTTNYHYDVSRVNLVYEKVWQIPGKCILNV